MSFTSKQKHENIQSWFSQCTSWTRYWPVKALYTKHIQSDVYKPTRCIKFLWLDFISLLDALHVSDYISPSSGATFYRLHIAFGTCRYRTSGCCVAIVTQPHNSQTYQHISNTMYSPWKLLLKMDWCSPKHVENLIEKV